MPHLTPAAWNIWLILILLQSTLAAAMGLSGTWRRWSSVFTFLVLISIRDLFLLGDVLFWHKPALYFYSFWWASLLIEIIEVWMIIQIGRELAGVSRMLCRAIALSIPVIASTSLVLCLIFAFQLTMPNYGRIVYITTHLDEAISFAWLGTFLVMAIASGIIGIEWSNGVRGIAIGFAIEVTAASATSFLRAHNFDLLYLSNLKGILYIFSLCVWGASLRPVGSGNEHRLVFSVVERCLNTYTRLFERSEGAHKEKC